MKLLDNKKYQVFHDGEKTETFQLRNGIPQGDSMSPILFNLYLNDLRDRFEENECTNDPVSVGNIKLSILIRVYADDILLFSQSKQGFMHSRHSILLRFPGINEKNFSFMPGILNLA